MTFLHPNTLDLNLVQATEKEKVKLIFLSRFYIMESLYFSQQWTIF